MPVEQIQPQRGHVNLDPRQGHTASTTVALKERDQRTYPAERITNGAQNYH
jgi:hypothetical protein